MQPLTAEPEAAVAPADGAAEASPVTRPPAPTRQCAKCGAPMADTQDWCLSCGAGAPGGGERRGWRPAVVAAAIAGLLVLGAAAASWAALSKGPRKPNVITRTVAAVVTPAPATPAPAQTTPLPATPKPTTSAKAPVIPLQTPTPTPVTPAPKPSTAVTTPATTPATTKPAATNEAAGEGNSPEALVLDTNAATTYNPDALPVGNFGDPTLAIDGDTATGWTVLVEPATAPKMQGGLAIDLKSAQRVAALELVTTSPGMTIQVYGSAAAALPSALTDPTWKQLTHTLVVHKRHSHIALKESTHAFRFIVVWISRAPSSVAGTTKSPARLSINELELFPPR